MRVLLPMIPSAVAPTVSWILALVGWHPQLRGYSRSCLRSPESIRPQLLPKTLYLANLIRISTHIDIIDPRYNRVKRLQPGALTPGCVVPLQTEARDHAGHNGTVAHHTLEGYALLGLRTADGGYSEVSLLTILLNPEGDMVIRIATTCYTAVSLAAILAFLPQRA